MNEIEIFDRLNAIGAPQFALTFGDNSEQSIKIAEFKSWFNSIRHEHPSTNKHFKIGVYIRYYNQTKHENYLDFHKQEFIDTIGLCPNWELVDFYVDEGQTAPNMENAPAWSECLIDAMDGKIDLIITQKVSNVSKKRQEVEFCSRILAAQEKPIGIYFVSEDIYSLSSYFLEDLRDMKFFPEPNWKILPDDEKEARLLLGSKKLLTERSVTND